MSSGLPRSSPKRTAVPPLHGHEKLRREVLSFFVAAVSPGLLIGVSVSVWSAVTREPSLLATLYIYPLVLALFGLLTTVPAILFAGYPIYLLYDWLGWKDWPRHVLGGAVIGLAFSLLGYVGLLPAQIWILAILALEGGGVPVLVHLGFVLLGGISASMFWFVFYTRRAERAFLIKVALVSLVTIALALLR